MRKISPINFSFVYVDDLTSSKNRIKVAYGRIFELAREKMRLDSSSTSKYSNIHDGRNILNPRRSGREVKSESNHNLSNVSVGENICSEVWQGMEDKQQSADTTAKRGGSQI